ncbi:hypothetical protein KI387_033734, partial [Taxus chinensis]
EDWINSAFGILSQMPSIIWGFAEKQITSETTFCGRPLPIQSRRGALLCTTKLPLH